MANVRLMQTDATTFESTGCGAIGEESMVCALHPLHRKPSGHAAQLQLKAQSQLLSLLQFQKPSPPQHPLPSLSLER